MRIIPPSEVNEKDLKKLDLVAKLPKDMNLLRKMGVIWIPYYEITSYSQGERIGATTFNAFLPTEGIKKEDLLLYFRPNFLDRKKQEKTGTPRFSKTRINKSLPVRPFSTQKLSKHINEFSRMVKQKLGNLRANYLDTLTEDVSIKRIFLPSSSLLSKNIKSKREEIKEEKEELKHFNLLEILLKTYLSHIHD